jgi:hypothetical protein
MVFVCCAVGSVDVLDDDAVRVDSEQFLFGGIGVSGADLVGGSGHGVSGVFEESDDLDAVVGFEAGGGLDDLFGEEHHRVFGRDVVDDGAAVAAEDARSFFDAEQVCDR